MSIQADMSSLYTLLNTLKYVLLAKVLEQFLLPGLVLAWIEFTGHYLRIETQLKFLMSKALRQQHGSNLCFTYLTHNKNTVSRMPMLKV